MRLRKGSEREAKCGPQENVRVGQRGSGPSCSECSSKHGLWQMLQQNLIRNSRFSGKNIVWLRNSCGKVAEFCNGALISLSFLILEVLSPPSSSLFEPAVFSLQSIRAVLPPGGGLCNYTS